MNATPILALDSTWEPRRWISLDDAMFYEYKNLVQARLGESLYVYHGGVSRMTGLQNTLETSSIVVISGQPKNARYREPMLCNETLFERDRHICAYCGSLYKKHELTRDHIVPVSRGGQDKWTNVVTACKRCNNLKDDLSIGEELPKGKYSPMGTRTMELLYVPYVPCKAEEMILRRSGRIKADQMEFLLDRIKNKDTSRIYKELSEQLKNFKASQ
jgi:5-methylcytosine-specific restriction endonuclease McrA